jgi:hypothetical protein
MCSSGDWDAFVLYMIRKSIQDWKLGQMPSESYLDLVPKVAAY